jgi:hypothetical protein
MNDCYSGNLYLTSFNRVVIADKGSEVFCEPFDVVLATKEELSNGIQLDELVKRILEAKHRQGFIEGAND